MDVTASVEVLLKEIEDRCAAVAEQDLTELTEDEVLDAVERAQRIRSMADALCLRTAGALDVSKAWTGDGARSATAWIAWRCRVPRSRASAAVAGARSLRSMPSTEAALLAGDITADHARLLAKAQATAPEAFAADGEERLLEAARTLTFRHFETAVRYWRHLNAPDDSETEARRRWLDRRLHCSTSFEGMHVIDALLDPVGGAIVARELERLDRELFEDDLAEARERLGRDDVSLVDLHRTPAQRRADALVRMAERSAAKPAGAVEPRVLLHVLAGNKTVERMCELSTGEVLTPGEVLPLLDKADAERAIFDGTGKVIDLGPRRRLFTGATRTAVQLRDRQCVSPTCEVPFERCEVDHIDPFTNGGLTVQDNGRCLCKYHHRRARPD
jgi:hypothetical protein